MKNTKKNKSITFEEALQNPSLNHLHAHLHYLQNTPPMLIFPKKNELALTDIVEIDIKDLFLKNPNLPIKKVITTVFEPLTDDIPAPLMLKLTKKIIAQWEKLSKEKNKNIAVAAH